MSCSVLHSCSSNLILDFRSLLLICIGAIVASTRTFIDNYGMQWSIFFLSEVRVYLMIIF